ncbi:MAG TPA: peptidase S8, partial [Microbacterium sp.]|nr:peptidase S8 [Microbacterium sp.]
MRSFRAAAAALVLTCALVSAPVAATAVDESPTPRPTASRSPSPSPTPTPDPVRTSEYWLEELGIDEAWKTTRGEGTTIAVIDSGIADDIDELDGAVVGGTDVSGVGSPDGRTPLGA